MKTCSAEPKNTEQRKIHTHTYIYIIQCYRKNINIYITIYMYIYMGYNSPRAILHSRLPIALKAPLQGHHRFAAPCGWKRSWSARAKGCCVFWSPLFASTPRRRSKSPNFSPFWMGGLTGLMRIFPWWILGVWPNKRVLLFWCALASYRAALYKNTYDIRSVFSLQDS